MSGANKGFDRVKGDQMGMLATVIIRWFVPHSTPTSTETRWLYICRCP